ncbi:MAG: DUF374 domain-containing protein [Pseudomonadota bacterium]
MGRKSKLHSLRRSIADWPGLTEAAAAPLAAWLRLVRATSRWDEDGYDALVAATKEHGSVIIVLWHERIFATPYAFKTEITRARSLNNDSRAGTLARAILKRFGFKTIGMRKGRNGLADTREVLRELAKGTSIGMAVDGPRGPARQSKTFPVQWARSSGKPVFVFAFAARHYVRWPSWDRLVLPLPFSRVSLVWRPWQTQIPRRPTPAEFSALIADLNNAIDGVTADADRRVSGHAIARN